ncbi:Uncharacterised protein [Vibrio cholerae]|nr:Uncharacterised protein [Vibrio cholerae]
MFGSVQYSGRFCGDTGASSRSERSNLLCFAVMPSTTSNRSVRPMRSVSFSTPNSAR